MSSVVCAVVVVVAVLDCMTLNSVHSHCYHMLHNDTLFSYIASAKREGLCLTANCTDLTLTSSLWHVNAEMHYITYWF